MDWIVWAAGYFEGEGCIFLKDGKYPRIAIGSTDPDVLAMFMMAVNCGNLNGPHSIGLRRDGTPKQPIYYFNICRRKEVEETALLLLPYLGERRTAKIKEVLSITDSIYKSEPCIAWAAGLYEGEGNITLQRGKYIYLSVKSTDIDVLDKFRDVVNTGNIYGPYTNHTNKNGKDNKPPYEFKMSNWNKVKLLTDQFLPYLSRRRREDIIKMMDHRPEAIREYNVSMKGKHKL